jgi:hypothetical protein
MAVNSAQLPVLQVSSTKNSVHTRRTMMFRELSLLLDAASEAASREEYRKLILEENVLRKKSVSNRMYTETYLSQLYALDPEDPVFSALRYFWKRAEQDRPLLALLTSYVRDHVLRTSWRYIKDMQPGSSPDKAALELLLETTYQDRYSQVVLRSTTRSLLSSWTQSGHLQGKKNKVRVHPPAGAAAVSYALFLGYLTGSRGQLLFSTVFADLLDCSLSELYELAHEASWRRMIIMKRIGEIIEVEFPQDVYGRRGEDE